MQYDYFMNQFFYSKWSWNDTVTINTVFPQLTTLRTSSKIDLGRGHLIGGERGYFKNDRKDNEKETKNKLNLFPLEK